MKRILKTAIALLSAGAIATPLAAAEWGVSGQVRVNWDIAKTIENKKAEAGGKTTPNGVFIAPGDTWVAFTLTGEAANGGIYYYGDGRQEYVGSVSAEDGNWTSAATISVRNDSNQNDVASSPRVGDTVEATKTGDHTVSVSNASGFSVKIGLTTPLLTFSQGAGNLLLGHTGANSHAGDTGGANIDTLDNRSNVVDFGYKLSDSLKVGLALEQSSSEQPALGKAFGSINYASFTTKNSDGEDYLLYGNTVTGDNEGAPSGFNTGIKANYSSDLVNVGLVVVSGSEAGNKDLGGDENYKASASAFGLGVGLSFGNLKPYFNLWNPSAKSENSRGSEEISSTTTQIGIDVALGESSGVGFSTVNRSTEHKIKSGDTEDDPVKITNAGIELGYVTKLGTADFKAGYLSVTEKFGDDKEWAVSWIRVRLQKSF